MQRCLARDAAGPPRVRTLPTALAVLGGAGWLCGHLFTGRPAALLELLPLALLPVLVALVAVRATRSGALHRADDARSARGEAELVESRRRVEELELELDNAQLLTQDAARLKAAFVANVTHEIRTPMNGVLGLTQLLATADLPPEQREQAELAHRSAQALLAVLDDILDFSRIEAGQLEIEPVDVDLRTLLDDTLGLFAGPAEAKNLQLTAVLDPHVPTRVVTDPSRLRQVLLNLVGNAVKFTEAGSVRLTITREATIGRGTAIRFAVGDTGVGIPPALQDLLFDPFRQGEDSTTRRYGGTGLGLTISSEIVRLLGGTLDVASRPDEGSTFSFTLLLSSAAPRDAVPEPRQAAARELPAFDGTGPLVLVAEDHPVNQKVVQGQLAALGYRSEVASDGVAAVEAVLGGSYDIVLMDCQMPRMDGYQATRGIRAAEAEGRLAGHLPVIAVTASATRGDRDRCLGSGMDDHLAKPVSMTLLAEALERWIGSGPAGSAPTADDAAPSPADDAPDEAPDEATGVPDLLDAVILADLATLPLDDRSAVLDSWRLATTSRLADLRTRVLQLAARNRIDEESGTRLEDLTRLAHSVKGSSASVAAARLAGVAAELETLGRTAMEGGDCFDGSGADVLVARLDEEFRRVEPVLQTALLGTAA